MLATMTARYYHEDMRSMIDKFVCEHCQKHKLPGKGCGLLPERELKEQPFEEVAVDLVGPWKVNIGKKEHTFWLLQSLTL